MSEIAELEQRIAAAFDRMDRGLDALRSAAAARADLPSPAVGEDDAAPQHSPAQAQAPQMAALLRALELANASAADWAERYRTLEVQMGTETMAMANEIARLTALLDNAAPQPAPAADHDAEIDELTARIAAQEAELETLRAERAADAAEIGELISALTPLVQEANHV